MVDAVAVLQPPTDVPRISMKVDERRDAISFLLGMADEVRVQRDFIASFYVHNFEGKAVDLGRGNTRSVSADVGIEQQIVLNRVKKT